MSTELSLIDGGLSYEQMAALMGIEVRSSGGIPQLKVNPDFAIKIDDVEYDLTPGTFAIEYNGQTVYSDKKKAPKFRTFLNSYQYQHYDPNFVTEDGRKGAYVNRSIIGYDFKKSTEYLDEKGGVKCGKVKDSPDLSAEQKALNKEVSCFRYLYGTVSFTGTTAQGQEVKIENYPCQIKSRGMNFLVWADEVEKQLAKSKKLPWEVETELTTERAKNGSTTYYIIHYAFDRSQKIIPTMDDVDLFKKFKETIKVMNEQVMEKHKDAIRGGSAEDLEDAGLVEEFNDDLPF